MPKRRIFIGDIQGCREELERLLERVKFDPASDEVHPVGDFVNRGPDSAGVLRVCRAIDAGGVLGNHDIHLLRTASGKRRRHERDTMVDVLDADDRAELIGWLAGRPLVRDLNDVLVVHAGISPAWRDPVRALTGLDPLEDTPELSFAIYARYCDAFGRRPSADWPVPGAPFQPWYAFWPRNRDERRTVVFGHWARGGLVEKIMVRGLDTGCVWGGELTAWIAEEDRFVDVPAARVYAPPD
ncbi:MAG: metallophosphoesterase [Planctomycetes bacterium]|nr:metallophosphoesterase [Planctomycetota bacterium]